MAARNGRRVGCQAAALDGVNHFLGRHECRQLPRNRPWMCIQYLCPAQRTILSKQGGAILSDLSHKIETIERQRLLMETDLVRCIRNNRRIEIPSIKDP